MGLLHLSSTVSMSQVWVIAVLATENWTSIMTTLGASFLVGILIGYALKKVVKLLAIVTGLFFAGLSYLQYQQIIDIRWVKLQSVSQNAASALANATTQTPGFSSGHMAALAITNFGIPLTGIMAIGFAVGFIKG
jgi:uncharacterized membrane protein (Fun14 family)